MLIRNFDPDSIYFKCRICGEARPKKDFPTTQKVCIDCAHKMNWHLPKRRGRRKKSETNNLKH